MTETHDLSSSGIEASSSDIQLHNDIVAMRERGALPPSSNPDACLTDGTEAVAIRDRELRSFCRRLLGASDAQAALVDDAVDSLRASVARGMPIALRGASDLVPVAYALHRRMLGADRPFVICDPRRCEGDGSVRTPPSRRTVALALEAAMDGSICLRSRHLPLDFDRLRRSLLSSAPVAMVFVCLHNDDRVRDLLCRPLEIRPLATRGSESDHLLQQALDEAATVLGTTRPRIPQRLRQGVLEHVTSFAELEKVALRTVALASARSLSRAAKLLGMASVSLMRWLHRRPWLVTILRESTTYHDHADD